MRRVNRRLKISERITKLQARATRAAERATRVWSRSVQGLGRAFRVAQRISGRFFAGFRRSIGRSLRGVATLTAKVAGITAGAVPLASNLVSRDIADTDREARAAGIDRNEFARLLRYLQIGSDGQLDREGAKDLVAEFRNRLGEASLEGQGATFDALDNLGRQLNDPALRQRILEEQNVAVQLGMVVDSLSKLNQRGFDTQFLSEELFGGTEGRIINEISNLSQEYVSRLNQVLNEVDSPISDEDVKNAQEFRLSMQELRGTLRKLLDRVIKPLLPSITETIQNITQSIQQFIADGGADRIREVMLKVASVISFVAGAIKTGYGILRPYIDLVVDAVQALIDGIVGAFRKAQEVYVNARNFFNRVLGRDEELVIDNDGRVKDIREASPAIQEIARTLENKLDELQRAREMGMAELQQSMINGRSTIPVNNGRYPTTLEPFESNEEFLARINEEVEARRQSREAMQRLNGQVDGLASSLESATNRINAVRPQSPTAGPSSGGLDLGQESTVE